MTLDLTWNHFISTLRSPFMDGPSDTPTPDVSRISSNSHEPFSSVADAFHSLTSSVENFRKQWGFYSKSPSFSAQADTASPSFGHSPSLIGMLIFGGCIAPQKHTWKTESILNTEYKDTGKSVTEEELRYKINAFVSDDGTLSFTVKKAGYSLDYDLLQPIQTEQQRQYAYGRSKDAAILADIGLGTIALGTALMLACLDDKCDQIPGGLVFMGGSVITGASGYVFWYGQKKTRPTTNYQTIEVPLTLEKKPAEENLESVVPAINTVVEISSPNFMINGTTPQWPPKTPTHSLSVRTNVRGDGTVQLIPSSKAFAFSLDDIANTEAASQLAEAGYSPEKYLPLLQQAAVPVSYDVTVKTNATDGKNAEVTIPVEGYEIPQKALEKVVMAL